MGTLLSRATPIGVAKTCTFTENKAGRYCLATPIGVAWNLGEPPGLGRCSVPPETDWVARGFPANVLLYPDFNVADESPKNGLARRGLNLLSAFRMSGNLPKK
jgi:hypothetical protein